MFNEGYNFIYNSHNTDSELNQRTGTTAKIIRPLSEEEINIAGTGNMYKIEFEDGFTTDIFEDEIMQHIDYEHLVSLQEEFDDLYAAACSNVRSKIVEHFFYTDNWTNEQIEEITGLNLYNVEYDNIFEMALDLDLDNPEKFIPRNEDGSIQNVDWEGFEKDNGYLFLDTFTEEYLDDLLMTNSDFDLQTMIEFANDFGIDLTGLEVPYKIIVLHDGPYNSLDNYKEIENLLLNEESIPNDMVEKYIVCCNKEELVEKWEQNLEESEGAWYGIKDGEGLLLGGSYDPNDIEDIEEYPTYIAEYDMEAKVTGYLYLDDKTIEELKSYNNDEDYNRALDSAMNELWKEADLGDFHDFEAERIGEGTLKVTIDYAVTVQAYTNSGAIAKAIDAFSKVDTGELQNIEISNNFEVVDFRHYEGPDKYAREAERLVNAVNRDFDAVIHFESNDVHGKNFTAFLSKDKTIEGAYEFCLKTNVDINGHGGKTIGVIRDLYNKEDIANALRNLDNGTAIVSSRNGKRNINEILDNANKNQLEY